MTIAEVLPARSGAGRPVSAPRRAFGAEGGDAADASSGSDQARGALAIEKHLDHDGGRATAPACNEAFA